MTNRNFAGSSLNTSDVDAGFLYGYVGVGVGSVGCYEYHISSSSLGYKVNPVVSARPSHISINCACGRVKKLNTRGASDILDRDAVLVGVVKIKFQRAIRCRRPDADVAVLINGQPIRCPKRGAVSNLKSIRVTIIKSHYPILNAIIKLNCSITTARTTRRNKDRGVRNSAGIVGVVHHDTLGLASIISLSIDACITRIC